MLLVEPFLINIVLMSYFSKWYFANLSAGTYVIIRDFTIVLQLQPYVLVQPLWQIIDLTFTASKDLSYFNK
jgi:hypothetical protein